METTSANLKK